MRTIEELQAVVAGDDADQAAVALVELGLAHHEAGRPDLAEAAFLRVIDTGHEGLAPRRARAWRSLSPEAHGDNEVRARGVPARARVGGTRVGGSCGVRAAPAEVTATGPLVLGTAGHVDHGKTALVLALTGRDTDRLPEEKARGISIALGFAPLELDADRAVSLVDVPGHERFVRHMVAGASGVDGYLLCVAADDGVMPQTVEHMAVLRLLGVTQGVVAVTKCDLSDPELAIQEVRELVGDGPEIVPVSSVTGAGIADLRAALTRLATRLGRRTAWGRPRLFVDRVFSVAGAGTVVTGTLWGGEIAVGDRVRIVPGVASARVRGVQAHDRPVDVAAGGRVALNLAGVERDDAPRGSCVVRAGDGWEPTTLLDVELTWLAEAGGPVRSRRRLQAFLGTAEVGATCVLLGANELIPGELGYAQLRLDVAVPAVAGDRLVLRSAERRTVGGARVVDPAPARENRRGAAWFWIAGADGRRGTHEISSPCWTWRGQVERLRIDVERAACFRL